MKAEFERWGYSNHRFTIGSFQILGGLGLLLGLFFPILLLISSLALMLMMLVDHQVMITIIIEIIVLKHKFSKKSEFILSAAFIDDEYQIDAIGDPVRILNEASLTNPSLGYDWTNLINDSDADNDGIFGIQLTDLQRQILANSITSSDGLLPYDLGDGNLISPLSEPNQGKEFRVKLKHDWNISSKTILTQQVLYRGFTSDFTRQTGAFNYVYWNRRGEINAEPRAPLVIDGIIYPFAARRQEYRHQEAEEKAVQYFADLNSKWGKGKLTGEHLFSVFYENRFAEVMSWSIYDADGNNSGNNPVPYILDIRNPNWGSGSFWDYDPSLRTNYDKTTASYGLSFQEVIYFDNKLTGRFGAAYSNIDQNYTAKGTDRNNNTATPEADTSDAGFSYNLGLNYRITKDLAAFVNYSKGRTAYSILGSVTGENDRPDSESKSFDLGLRFNGFQQKMLASLVYFKTRRTNLRRNNDLFNDNIFYDKWNEQKNSYDLLDYLLPSEDIEDLIELQKMSKDIETYDFSNLINKYDITDNIILIINKEGDNIRTLSKINLNNNLKLENKNYSKVDILNNNDFSNIVKSLKQIYEDQWKKNNEINTSIKLPITISINSKKTKKIIELERVLGSIDLVSDFNILNFNSKSTQYKIIYNGTPNIFLNDMRKNNLELEMKNNIWTIK